MADATGGDDVVEVVNGNVTEEKPLNDSDDGSKTTTEEKGAAGAAATQSEVTTKNEEAAAATEPAILMSGYLLRQGTFVWLHITWLSLPNKQ